MESRVNKCNKITFLAVCSRSKLEKREGIVVVGGIDLSSYLSRNLFCKLIVPVVVTG